MLPAASKKLLQTWWHKTNLFSHSYRGQKSKIKVLARLVPLEVLRENYAMPFFYLLVAGNPWCSHITPIRSNLCLYHVVFFPVSVSSPFPFLFFFLRVKRLIDWLIDWFRQREREAQRHRQREKQAPLREPDVGLDPGSPGSRPGLQVALNRGTTRAALPFLSKDASQSLDLGFTLNAR